jgi:hypothetical protein
LKKLAYAIFSSIQKNEVASQTEFSIITIEEFLFWIMFNFRAEKVRNLKYAPINKWLDSNNLILIYLFKEIIRQFYMTVNENEVTQDGKNVRTLLFLCIYTLIQLQIKRKTSSLPPLNCISLHSVILD